MSFKQKAAVAAVLCALAAMIPIAGAQTIRIANQGDALSLDPHSLNEALQMSIALNIYEPLVGRNKDLGVMPLLATGWKLTSPTVWRFALRHGVTFQDGTPFSADDVVFSIARGQSEGSNMKAMLSSIKAVRKVDDYTVDIETTAPQPILPDQLSAFGIMSKKWCEDNKALHPVDRRKGIENAATFRANGTGPFRVIERQPDVRTVFERNERYWGTIEGNARKVVFTPIANPATRVSALVSGAVDVIEPVPLQDIPRINANPGTHVMTGPEMRTVYLGMDQKRDELLYSSIKGKNPFKDQRVRQAFYQAIDIEGIQRTVMRGSARPTALLVGPGVNGWNAEQDKRLPYDPPAAKKLLAEAGYPDGFELRLNCPNDRYVNDSQICQAVASNLAKIGVKVDLLAETKAIYLPKLGQRDTSFYMLGWMPTTYDAYDVLNSLTVCPGDKTGAGQFNQGGYCNPKVDGVIRQIGSETDNAKRHQLIKQAFAQIAADVGYLPLHQQFLAWGVSKKVTLVQQADDRMYFKWMSIAP